MLFFHVGLIFRRLFLGLRLDSLKIFPPMQNTCLSVSSSSSDRTSCSTMQYTKLLTVQYSICSSYFHWFLKIHFIHLFSSTLLVFFYIRSLLSFPFTSVGTLIVANIYEYLQLIQNRYMLRSFTVLQCSHQHCVQPVASDVEVVGYL